MPRGRVVARYGGMEQRVYTDVQTGRTVLESAPDNATLSRMFEDNKRVQNSMDSLDRWGDGDVVASIPPAVVFQLMKEEIWPGPKNGNDPRPLKRWLNDPENRAWRLRTGRI